MKTHMRTHTHTHTYTCACWERWEELTLWNKASSSSRAMAQPHILGINRAKNASDQSHCAHSHKPCNLQGGD
eukprot:3163985-Amphidinium_carterae.1